MAPREYMCSQDTHLLTQRSARSETQPPHGLSDKDKGQDKDTWVFSGNQIYVGNICGGRQIENHHRGIKMIQSNGKTVSFARIVYQHISKPTKCELVLTVMPLGEKCNTARVTK
jgi:hypothetical protein